MIPTTLLLSFVPLLSPQGTEPKETGQNAMVAEATWPPSLELYLPAGQAYDPDFPKPESVLGWPVGTWHVRHDQLVRWFETCAEASPRMELESYGATHEARPLLLAVVSSQANLARIDEIRAAHRLAVLSGAEDYDGPAVVWMGYGVHGNESSASNASLLLAYHLAAAEGDEMESFLEKTVVLIDPCVNPDGGARFAHWANMHRSVNVTGESSHRDHSEAWPGGRTNHYWFDLNRDWLLLTHPESRGRVAEFHRWMPTVLTDYHEMGSGSSYFFQPGIPSRRNPMTPESNHALTAEISEYHARALDAMGSQYFTEERFDDFYYGKGSTYPDIHGSIGILFEQASSRGHRIDTDRGELTFPFTIRNQFTTSLTTLQAALEMRDKLGRHQREFYAQAVEEAASGELGGWIFGDAADPARVHEMASRLVMHDIRVDPLEAPLAGSAYRAFQPGSAYVVPAAQPQFRLIKALFETRTSWDDNTFYDVSAWSFPLSFDVPLEEIPQADWTPELAPLGDVIGARKLPPLRVEEPLAVPDSAVAYAFQWHGTHAPKALANLHRAGFDARVATEPFSAETPNGLIGFDRGTIVVASGPGDEGRQALTFAAAKIHMEGLANVRAITSGLTPEGSDLGSGGFSLVKPPKIALLVGGRTSAYEAGEIWHDLDTRVGLAITLLERPDGPRGSDLAPFSHLILVNGATSSLDDEGEERIRTWVRAGGTLIATKGSALWASKHLLAQPDPEENVGKKKDEEPATEGEPAPDPPARYGDYENLRAQERVAGTIFQATLDRTHPLGFGFTRDELPVFRNFEEVLPEGPDPFASPLRYGPTPLLSGFASEANVERIAGSPAIRAERLGSGTVIAMVDNPVFRGVWYGTRRLLLNAIYFSRAIRRTGPIDQRTEEEEAAYDHGHAHNR